MRDSGDIPGRVPRVSCVHGACPLELVNLRVGGGVFISQSVVKFVVRRRVLRAIRHRVARARVTQRARSAHTVDCESTVCATAAALPTSRCALK